MKSIIQAQEAFIAQVNACNRPNDRKHRVRRSANRKLRSVCIAAGYTQEQQDQALRDAWDVAELERNAD